MLEDHDSVGVLLGKRGRVGLLAGDYLVDLVVQLDHLLQDLLGDGGTEVVRALEGVVLAGLVGVVQGDDAAVHLVLDQLDLLLDLWVQ